MITNIIIVKKYLLNIYIMNDPKVLEALQYYYKNKNRYDQALEAKKKIIINNNTISLKEKRELYKKIRISCIHCKKLVGTQFIDKDRKLQIKCGATKYDKYPPCKLNIIIQKGNFETIPWALQLFEQDKEYDKDEIIKTKLNMFFQFSNEINTTSVFDKIKKEFSSNNNEHESLLNELIDLTPYLKNKKLIEEHSKKMTKKKYDFISIIKQAKKKEHDDQFIKDAVELYINDLLPMIEQDRALKYSYYHLEEDFYNTKLQKLVVSESSVSNMEFIIDNDPNVIQYIK
jgi:hypothetical protein